MLSYDYGMSNKLLIFIGEDQAFDVDAVDRVLTSLVGWSVDRLGPGIGALQQYICVRNQREVMVRISTDAETVVIDGHLDASSADLALLLQNGLPNQLRMTDMAYNFDLALGDYATAQKLVAAMPS